jgi:hypothetical protein
MVQSGPDRGLFWGPLKTPDQGLELICHGPVPRILDWTVENGPVSSLKMETVKKTRPYGLALSDYSPVWSLEIWDRTIRSGLRLDRKLSFAFPSQLEHVSVTPKYYS